MNKEALILIPFGLSFLLAGLIVRNEEKIVNKYKRIGKYITDYIICFMMIFWMIFAVFKAQSCSIAAHSKYPNAKNESEAIFDNRIIIEI